ncbi:hypothetical protein Q5752_000953 [Cryptotrichosporon argae]
MSSSADALPGVPTTYLESYPFPAFVFAPTPSKRRSRVALVAPEQTDAAPTAASTPSTPRRAARARFRVAWSNARWADVGRGEPLESCLDAEARDALDDWIGGGDGDRDGEAGAGTVDDATFELTLACAPVRLQLVKAPAAPADPGLGQEDGPRARYCIVTCVQLESPQHWRGPPPAPPSCGPTSISASNYAALSTPTSAAGTPETGSSTASTPTRAPSPATLGESTPAEQADRGRPAPASRRRSGRLDGRSGLFEPLVAGAGPGTASPARQETDCRVLLDQTDWSKTSLGPRESWSPQLECMINLVIDSNTQDSLWLGTDFVQIYNQGYSKILNHPTGFGRPAIEQWASLWEGIGPIIDRGMRGESCYFTDDLLLYAIGPTGNFCERYHTWSFVPIRGDGGRVLGLYNPTTETTDAVLARRRQETMRDLSEEIQVARSSKQYFAGIADVFERNPKDIPFALCYSIAKGADGEGSTLTLEQSVGVPADHPAGPAKIIVAPRDILHVDDIGSPAPSAMSAGSGRFLHSSERAAWPIAYALQTRQCVVVDDCAAIVKGCPVRQWDALPEAAIIIPICSDGAHEPAQAVLILGLNLYCPLDADYEEWIHVMRAHLTSSLASVRSFEVEQQRLLDKERMERAKTAWFQGAAHDLRSPLTLVVGPLEDVLATKLTSAQRSALGLAQRNASRVLRLVNALLDFSRLEAGRLEGRFVATDLGRFVGELAELFRPAIERRHITFNVDIQPREGVVFIDPTLLETVVTNLLSNALKYTEEGEISVRLSYDANHADIAVVDTGFGIPSGELGAVTDRFHRATTALSRGTEGTGIGLALAKEIVRLHDGELLIESRIADEHDEDGEHGSTFTARIPLVERDVVFDSIKRESFGTYGKAVADDAMGWSDDTASESDRAPSEPTTAGTLETFLFEPGDTLLIVDDDHDMRKYIRHIFSPYVAVLEAGGAEEALEIARQHPTDLILSDVMMRGQTGVEFCMAIRQEPATRLVPVVLHSAAIDDETRMAALTSGADDFLAKPFRPRELLARVHLHMQLGKRRQDLEARYAAREQELRVLSDHCPSGIMRADTDGRIVYGNAAWRAFAGIGDDEDPSKWPAWVADDDGGARRAQLMAEWDDVVHGEHAERTLTWTWRNGTTVSGRFIRLDMMVPGMTGVLGCLADITLQLAQLRAAEDRRREAEESKRQQELLIDTTSHEIRTPISAILQCSSLARANLKELRVTLTRPDFRPSAKLFRDIDDDIEALESIYQCGLTQERIANDVLSLGRIQLDMLTFYDAPMDIQKDISKIISVFKSEAAVKDIQLVFEVGPSFARTGVAAVKTDHVRLGQVITNLVSNAMRFIATSQRRLITVRCDVAFRSPEAGTCAVPDIEDGDLPSIPPPDDTPAWLYVSVHDTGPGLGPDELQMLFQRFSQGSTMIHSRYGGSGLGLFICRRITELLDGRIEVQSVLGQGSVFRFFIKTRTAAAAADEVLTPTAAVHDMPIRPALSLPAGGDLPLQRPLLNDPTAQGRRPSSSAASDSSSLQPSSLPMSPFSPGALSPSDEGAGSARSLDFYAASRPLHLLVVEDNKINQTVLKRQVTKVGWSCDVADDGQEALILVHDASTGERALPGGRKRYDVIVMDLEMPVMDGLTAVRHIRAAEAAGELERQVVIALTGNARQEQIDTALAAGMDDVVIKPYRLPDLMAKLRAAGQAPTRPAQPGQAAQALPALQAEANKQEQQRGT